jgi:YgiT-type zinc finger domain-containing protein
MTKTEDKKCYICKNPMVETKINLEMKADERFYVIPNQECYKCIECGETIFTSKQTRQIQLDLNRMSMKNIL